MLPPHVKLVLLSATVPNVTEVAEWVGRTRRSHVYVVQTHARPVPLVHHVYFKGELLEICRSTMSKDDMKTAIGRAYRKVKEAAAKKEADKAER